MEIYEIEHPTIEGIDAVKDWIVADSAEKAIEMLESHLEFYSDHYVSFAHCKITALPLDTQTMTKRGLLSVKEILDICKTPQYIKAGS